MIKITKWHKICCYFPKIQSIIMPSFSLEKNFNKAVLCTKNGDLEKASDLFLEILTKFPKNLRAKNGLIQAHEIMISNYKQNFLIFFKQNKYSEIIRIGTKLIEKFNYSYFIWDILGASFLNQGNFNDAIWAYQKLIFLNENYAEAYINLGQAFHATNRYDEAIKSYKKAISLKPKHILVHYYLGMSLEAVNNTEEAINSYKKTIKVNPNYAKTFFRIADINNMHKDLDEAIYNYKKAILINPNYNDALNNLGNALMSKGLISEAIINYNKAIKIKPTSKTYNNLGVAFKTLGNHIDAIKNYNNAIGLEPNNAEAFYNKGIIYQKIHQYENSVNSYKKAILINPNYENAYYNLGIALKDVAFNRPIIDLNNIIINILERKTYLNPNEISKTLIYLLKNDNQIKNIIENNSFDKLEQSFAKVTSQLSKIPLLMKLLSIWSFVDLEFENLFKNLRSIYLLKINKINLTTDSLSFLSALSQQCFINEFIYPEEENERILKLEDYIEKKLLKGEQPDPKLIICLATYKPLYKYKWVKLLKSNEIILDVYKMQVLEPLEEKKLKKSISVFNKITDKVSSKVKHQYESSPYPRWVNTSLLLSPISINEVVNQLDLKLVNNNVKDIINPNILVAGCGTGEHAIKVANRFKDSNILAVDLSLRSLAYAKRKTEELNLKNIEYIQADILNLKNYRRQFDIVECVGTLHHMDKPIEGWKTLVDCLNPDGLMKIGLYSKLARVNVIKIRDQIKRLKIGSSDNDIRLFRNQIINSELIDYKSILSSEDFYCLSSLRDLLFHVQEHSFTLPQIRDYLDKLGLRFCGFENIGLKEGFNKQNFGNYDHYDLDKWDMHEKNNPSIFGNMYQFWCQKIQ